MADETEPNARGTACPPSVMPPKPASGRWSTANTHPVGRGISCALKVAGWHELLAGLFLAAATISAGFAGTTAERILLPIEI